MADTEMIARVLSEVRAGDADALERLVPLVYDELRVLARQQLRRLRPGASLNTTALVHEAFLKLFDPAQASWKDKAHLLAASALAMRHLVVDYVRNRTAGKRGGNIVKVQLDDWMAEVEPPSVDVLAVDDALTALSLRSERLGRLVELRFFGGLTNEEISEVMGISTRTAKRDWQKARAFLYKVMNQPRLESPSP